MLNFIDPFFLFRSFFRNRTLLFKSYLGFGVLNNVSSLLLQFHDLKSVEITKVGSEGFLDDFLGPGGFSPFSAHVSSFPCFFDGGGLGAEKKFQLEFGQLDVVHVDFFCRESLVGLSMMTWFLSITSTTVKIVFLDGTKTIRPTSTYLVKTILISFSVSST